MTNATTQTLENKIQNLSTETLIDMFKKLADDLSDEADDVNTAIMHVLRDRMNEEEYNNLLDEVYED